MFSAAVYEPRSMHFLRRSAELKAPPRPPLWVECRMLPQPCDALALSVALLGALHAALCSHTVPCAVGAWPGSDPTSRSSWDQGPRLVCCSQPHRAPDSDQAPGGCSVGRQVRGAPTACDTGQGRSGRSEGAGPPSKPRRASSLAEGPQSP